VPLKCNEQSRHVNVTCLIPILLHGCIRWYQFVRNDDVRRLTKQPKLTIIQSRQLTLFGYAHGRQRICQEDPVLPSGRLEKTTRSSPHHMAQHRPTGSETTPPHAPQSSRFGSEPPSVEDDVDVWRYAILELRARNDNDEQKDIPLESLSCSRKVSLHIWALLSLLARSEVK